MKKKNTARSPSAAHLTDQQRAADRVRTQGSVDPLNSGHEEDVSTTVRREGINRR
jgi:hypothetical protein